MKFLLEMMSLQYRFNRNETENPYVVWGELGNREALQQIQGDLNGPLTYTYTFSVPTGEKVGSIRANIEDGVHAAVQPINIKAFIDMLKYQVDYSVPR